MRYSLFWDVKQRGLVVSYCFTLEDETDRLSRNVGNYQSTLRNIPEGRISQHKSSIFFFLGKYFSTYVVVTQVTQWRHAFSICNTLTCKILFRRAWNLKRRAWNRSYASWWRTKSHFISQTIFCHVCSKHPEFTCIYTQWLSVCLSARIGTRPPPFTLQIANVLKWLSMPDDWK
jgi:hypothetical protein